MAFRQLSAFQSCFLRLLSLFLVAPPAPPPPPSPPPPHSAPAPAPFAVLLLLLLLFCCAAVLLYCCTAAAAAAAAAVAAASSLPCCCLSPAVLRLLLMSFLVLNAPPTSSFGTGSASQKHWVVSQGLRGGFGGYPKSKFVFFVSQRRLSTLISPLQLGRGDGAAGMRLDGNSLASRLNTFIRLPRCSGSRGGEHESVCAKKKKNHELREGPSLTHTTCLSWEPNAFVRIPMILLDQLHLIALQLCWATMYETRPWPHLPSVRSAQSRTRTCWPDGC